MPESEFLYFFPDRKSAPSRKTLKDRCEACKKDPDKPCEEGACEVFVQKGHLLNVSKDCCAEVCLQGTSGPGGLNGVIVAWRPNLHSATGQPTVQKNECVGHYPDTQKWIPSPCGTYWLGWYVDSPPGPFSLRHKYQRGTAKVMLEDGNGDHAEWLFIDYMEIPNVIQVDDEGEEFRGPGKRYEKYADLIGELLAQLRGGEDSEEPGMKYVKLEEFAREAIMLNYRITPQGMSVLSIVNEGSTGVEIFFPVMSEYLERCKAIADAES